MKRTITISRFVPTRTLAAARLRQFADRTLFCCMMLLALLGSGLPALAASNSTNGVIVADFNHDGIPDILVATPQYQGFTITFGAAPYGSFNSASMLVPYPSTCNTKFMPSIATADFNGDGIPDLAITCQGSGQYSISLYVLLGHGDGTFTTSTAMYGLENILVGDFNKNGKQDIIVEGAYKPGIQSMGFYAGNGDGTFGTPVASYLTAPQYATGIAVDVNLDGYLDLAFGNFASAASTNSLDVYQNNQNGTFGTGTAGTGGPIAYTPTATSLLQTTGTPNDTAILAGNFTGRGFGDVVVVDAGSVPGIFVPQYSGSATAIAFAGPATKFPVAALTGAVAANFVSTYTDLLIANGTALTVYTNNGTGSFTESYSGLTFASTATQFAAADANGDGYPDVYTAVPSTSGLTLTVNLVSGSATAISAPFALAAGTIPVSATWPGNVNFTGSNASGSQIVNAAATTTALTSSLNPSIQGQSVTFTATVAAVGTVSQIPAGSVTFMDGSTTLGSVNLNDAGVAMYTTSSLAAASHAISAVYSGNTTFGASQMSLTQVVNSNLILTSFTPNTAQIGASATTIIVTGAGFVSTTVAQINGAAIATTLVNATTLTAIVPASDFLTAGTLLLTLTNSGGATTGSLPLTVTAPPLTATLAAPTTSSPGSQPAVTLTIPAYPVALTATFTLSLKSSLSSGVTDPNVVFSNGQTSYTVTIPAGSTTTPTAQLQAGTVAETITVSVALFAGTVNVTPTNLAPVTIAVPAAVPVATTATLTRSGNVLTVTIDGFSNTREIVQANFHFVAGNGATLSTTDFTAPVSSEFATYYSGSTSLPYGSSFVYIQTFNVDGSANSIGSVQVTLTNTIGVSTTVTAQ